MRDSSHLIVRFILHVQLARVSITLALDNDISGHAMYLFVDGSQVVVGVRRRDHAGCKRIYCLAAAGAVYPPQPCPCCWTQRGWRC